MVGDKIKAVVYGTGYEKPTAIEGTVIFENQHHITVQTKHYPTSINKYEILTHRAKVVLV